jgi:CubicO group peptidase (beta-lactamase class C family)
MAGSLMKPVFAAAVLELVRRKVLDLDQAIAQYLPDELMRKEPRLKLVTARMFLSHSSGIAGPLDAPAFNFPPGQRFEYASRGFQLMQLAVERLTGLSLARFVETEVLAPCGMHNSSIGWTTTQLQRAAQGHFKNGKPRSNRTQGDPSAASGLITTAGDYARFMLETLRSKTEMLKPLVKVGDDLAWGLGWALEDDAFWHWGDQDIFKSFALMDTKKRTGIVILTNSANGHHTYAPIVTSALGSDHPSLAWVEKQYE